MDGTYPLPEAQLDRFLFKVQVEFPTSDDLHLILDRTTGWTERRRSSPVMDKAGLMQLRQLAMDVPIAQTRPGLRPCASSWRPTPTSKSDGPEAARRYIRVGASPRGAQAMVVAAKVRAILDGRFAVSADDIKKVAHPALRHRIIRNFEGEAEGIKTTRSSRPSQEPPERPPSRAAMGVLDFLSRAPKSLRGRSAMPAEDLFDDEFQRKLDYLAMVSKRVFSGAMRSERRTKKVGSGVEFADHRDYAPGDDLRALDWHAYSRFQRLLVRLYEEEEDLSIYFIIDSSRSMGFGDGEKLRQAKRLCAALAYVGCSRTSTG
jgi:hypothetical protein